MGNFSTCVVNSQIRWDSVNDVFVYLKDGTKITYNILRNENVMDIDVNSVLVHDGKIVESGTHDELYAKEGKYRAMYEAQYNKK